MMWTYNVGDKLHFDKSFFINLVCAAGGRQRPRSLLWTIRGRLYQKVLSYGVRELQVTNKTFGFFLQMYMIQIIAHSFTCTNPLFTFSNQVDVNQKIGCAFKIYIFPNALHINRLSTSSTLQQMETFVCASSCMSRRQLSSECCSDVSTVPNHAGILLRDIEYSRKLQQQQ